MATAHLIYKIGSNNITAYKVEERLEHCRLIPTEQLQFLIERN
jgi:hypothetical protein